jgi:hypothetical protein
MVPWKATHNVSIWWGTVVDVITIGVRAYAYRKFAKIIDEEATRQGLSVENPSRPQASRVYSMKDAEVHSALREEMVPISKRPRWDERVSSMDHTSRKRRKRKR